MFIAMRLPANIDLIKNGLMLFYPQTTTHIRMKAIKFNVLIFQFLLK